MGFPDLYSYFWRVFLIDYLNYKHMFKNDCGFRYFLYEVKY